MKFYGKCGAVADAPVEDDDYLFGIRLECPKCSKWHEFTKKRSQSQPYTNVQSQKASLNKSGELNNGS